MFAQHPYGAWPWAGGAWAPPSVVGPTIVYWPARWCPMAGLMRINSVIADSVQYGDGYKHRSTRGFNPIRPKIDYQFPFVNGDGLVEMDAFLQAYGAGGFYFDPPDQIEPTFVVCNEWSATITDRAKTGEMVGFLRATFMRAYNYQPMSPVA